MASYFEIARIKGLGNSIRLQIKYQQPFKKKNNYNNILYGALHFLFIFIFFYYEQHASLNVSKNLFLQLFLNHFNAILFTELYLQKNKQNNNNRYLFFNNPCCSKVNINSIIFRIIQKNRAWHLKDKALFIFPFILICKLLEYHTFLRITPVKIKLKF